MSRDTAKTQPAPVTSTERNLGQFRTVSGCTKLRSLGNGEVSVNRCSQFRLAFRQWSGVGPWGTSFPC
jgi:hypothetical protein